MTSSRRGKEPPLTVGQIILKSAQWLDRKGIDSPRLDAELLLAYVLDCSRLDLYLQWEKPLIELEMGNYRELIRSRGQDRTPVARLLGKKEFYGRDFEVSPATFVPRPETEGVVDRALELLSSDPALRVDKPVVLEVGTGTGAIIVSLAAEDAQPRYIATDISADALATARKNAAAIHVESRIDFRHGSGLCGYDGALHLLVSNPPYIPEDQIPTLPPEVKDHDPMAALLGPGSDGLDCVREMLDQAKGCLAPGAWVVLEIGEDQEEPVLAVFEKAGIFTDARVERDLAGQPRYAMARRKA
ncbi:peptide chain release factor N(5)-glutamine methyltransferase [bacterium]|nr:peptide chain release factor N(5)-glutamine methyltransferase [bacterium]